MSKLCSLYPKFVIFGVNQLSDYFFGTFFCENISFSYPKIRISHIRTFSVLLYVCCVNLGNLSSLRSRLGSALHNILPVVVRE